MRNRANKCDKAEHEECVSRGRTCRIRRTWPSQPSDVRCFDGVNDPWNRLLWLVPVAPRQHARATSSLCLLCILVETAQHAPQGMEHCGGLQQRSGRARRPSRSPFRSRIRRLVSGQPVQPPLPRCPHWPPRKSLASEPQLQIRPWTSGSRMWRHFG